MHATPLILPLELVCRCGIAFEPPPWFDPDTDEPACVECSDSARRLQR